MFSKNGEITPFSATQYFCGNSPNMRELSENDLVNRGESERSESRRPDRVYTRFRVCRCCGSSFQLPGDSLTANPHLCESCTYSELSVRRDAKRGSDNELLGQLCRWIHEFANANPDCEAG